MLSSVVNPKLAVAAVLALMVSACGSDDDMAGPTTTTPTQTDSGVGRDTSQVTEGYIEPGSQKDLDVKAGSHVFFAYDSYDLDQRSQQTLRNQATWMNSWPNKTFTIEGHADERGTREYNLALGARRADAVKRYLIGLGIDANRVRTISYGKERPEVVGSYEDAWARNRRAVTVVD